MSENPGVNSAMLASMENAQQHAHSGATAAASSGGTFGNITTSSIDNEYGHLSGNLGVVTNLGSVDSVIPTGANGGAMASNPFTEFSDHGNMSPFGLHPGLGADFKADNMGFGSIGADNIGLVKQTNGNIPRLFSGAQQGH